jgi:hypothetical protein
MYSSTSFPDLLEPGTRRKKMDRKQFEKARKSSQDGYDKHKPEMHAGKKGKETSGKVPVPSMKKKKKKY